MFKFESKNFGKRIRKKEKERKKEIVSEYSLFNLGIPISSLKKLSCR